MTNSSHHDAGYMVLIIHLKDGSDAAFLTLTEDEIFAMMCAEEGTPKTVIYPSYMRLKWLSVDTPAEHVFSSMEEDNPVGVKITFTSNT